MNIDYPKNKFTQTEWDLIKKHLDGAVGEIHHEAGKPYEYLATLRPMTVQGHSGNGHKKYVFGLPEDAREKNIRLWRLILGEDFNHFEVKGLVG